jgi:hypothetical protein
MINEDTKEKEKYQPENLVKVQTFSHQYFQIDNELLEVIKYLVGLKEKNVEAYTKNTPYRSNDLSSAKPSEKGKKQVRFLNGTQHKANNISAI